MDIQGEIRGLRLHGCKLEYKDENDNWIEFADLTTCLGEAVIAGEPGEVLRCRISEYLTTYLKRAQDLIIVNAQNFSSGATAGAAILSLGVVIGGILSAGTFAVVAGAIGTAAEALLSEVVSRGASSYDAALDMSFYSYVRCRLYGILPDDGQITGATINEWVAAIREYDAANNAEELVANFVAQVPLEQWRGLAAIGSAIPAPQICEPCVEACRDWRYMGTDGGWTAIPVGTPAAEVVFQDPLGVYGTTEEGSVFATIIHEALLPLPYQIRFEPANDPKYVWESDIDSMPPGANPLVADVEGFYTITKPYVLLQWTVTVPASVGAPGNNPVFYKFCYRDVPQMWCYEWSFAGGANGWTGESGTSWSNGGWADGGSQNDAAYIYITGLPTFNASRVELDFNMDFDGNNPKVYVGSYPAGNWLAEAAVSGQHVGVDVEITDASTLYIVADRWVGGGQYFGNLRLTAVRLRGAGANPLGEVNCT